MLNRVVQLLRVAAWAPIAVLLVHQISMRTPWRSELNWTIHFLGGAAAAYFLFHAARTFARELGPLRPITHHLLAFALAAVVALSWEFAEFVIDHLWRWRLQQSLTDTMGDLFFGMLGALCALVVVALVEARRPEAATREGVRPSLGMRPKHPRWHHGLPASPDARMLGRQPDETP